jgi:SAM-dependent methyltransferase
MSEVKEEANSPVIIVGCQRSGTSALWRALMEHSQLKPARDLTNLAPGCEKELWYIQDFMRGRRQSHSQKCYGSDIDNKYLSEYFQFISNFIGENHGSESGRWLYSNPSDGLYAKEILSYLPEAKIVFMVRHPQEVVWSSLHAPWEKTYLRQDFLLHARQIAQHWNRFAEVCLDIQKGSVAKQVLVVFNESLRNEPETVLDEVYRHIDLKPEPAVFDKLTSGAFHSSFLTQKDDLKKIGKTNKDIAKDREFCQAILDESSIWMKKFGYSDLSVTVADRQDVGESAGDENRLKQSDNHQNEAYWKENLDWYQQEITRRKLRQLYYHNQEILLERYFSDYREHFGSADADEPRVLEFGYGFGRHLQYLRQVKGIDLYGCDQSPQSLKLASSWAPSNWPGKKLLLTQARGRLPYEDNSFDVVFSVSVLIHIQPEDLEEVLKELKRICRGHILHLENPETDHSYMTASIHEGCWAHPLQEAYAKLNLQVELLPSFTARQSVYRVIIDESSYRPSLFGHMCKKMLDTESIVEELEQEIDQQNRRINELAGRLNSIYRTRAMQIYRWIESKRWLSRLLIKSFDLARRLISGRRTPAQVKKNTGPGEFVVGDPSNEILAICHPHWQGVRSAAEGQSPNRLYLGESPKGVVEKIAENIKNSGFRKIIINGYWDGYDYLIELIHQFLPDARVFFVYHGSFFQMEEDNRQPYILARMIEFYRRGLIKNIGFVKKGMPETMRRFGIDAKYVMNRVPPASNRQPKVWRKPVKVGIPVTGKVRKNPHTQVLAALMVDDIDEVHVWYKPDLQYLKRSGANIRKLRIHQDLDRIQTRKLIEEMDLVLYVTISECFPIVPLECFAAGVPCITGETHGILDSFDDVRERLMVTAEDDPIAIAEKIRTVKENYEELSKRVIEVFEELDGEAEKNLANFLNAN